MIASIFLNALIGMSLGFLLLHMRKSYQPRWWVAFILIGIALIAWAGFPELWTELGLRDRTSEEMANAIYEGPIGRFWNYVGGIANLAAALTPYAYLGAIRDAIDG